MTKKADTGMPRREKMTAWQDWVWNILPNSGEKTAVAMAGLAATTALIPYGWLPAGVAGLVLGTRAAMLARRMPIRMPQSSGGTDRSDPHPATGKPSPAKGIFFIGNVVGTEKEIWLTGDDVRQHSVVFQTNDDERRKTLLAMASNTLTWGGGCLLVMRGDISMFHRVMALCNHFGRVSDFMFLNFLENRERKNNGPRFSSRMDPFRTGTPESITQLLVGVIQVDSDVDSKLWTGRLIGLLLATLKCLCFLRDKEGVTLSADRIMEYISLPKLMEITESASYSEIPIDLRANVVAYLSSLPGFVASRGRAQSQVTCDQHGYCELLLRSVLATMGPMWGDVFQAGDTDIDITDVVSARRIVLVLLPSWSVVEEEANLPGRIVMALLKSYIAGSLNPSPAPEETWDEVIGKSRIPSPPFLCIFDEVGEYILNGTALMSAQGRAMGYGMVYGSQDLPTMRRNNEKEAASIIANTSTKIFMRTEEADRTSSLSVNMGGHQIPDTRAFRYGTSRFNNGIPMTVRIPQTVALPRHPTFSLSTSDPSVRGPDLLAGASIMRSNNTKIFMRTEDEPSIPTGSAPTGDKS